MVGFEDVINYLGWGLLAVGLIVAIIVVSRIREALAGVSVKKFGEIFVGSEQDRQEEGMFYWLVQLARTGLFLVTVYVGVSILLYLLNSPPDQTIYDQILSPSSGVPQSIVILTVAMYAFKTVPRLMHRAERAQSKEA